MQYMACSISHQTAFFQNIENELKCSSKFKMLSIFQAPDSCSYGFGWRAERGATSTVVADQSAESRQRLDHRRSVCGGHLLKQPTTGTESRPSTQSHTHTHTAPEATHEAMSHSYVALI